MHTHKNTQCTRMPPDSHLMPVSRSDIIVLSPQVRCCNNELHVEIGVIIL